MTHATATAADPNTKPLLKCFEAAYLLGVSQAKVRRWTKEGVLRPIRSPGCHPVFRRADLDAFMTGREPSPTT